MRRGSQRGHAGLLGARTSDFSLTRFSGVRISPDSVRAEFPEMGPKVVLFETETISLADRAAQVILVFLLFRTIQRALPVAPDLLGGRRSGIPFKQPKRDDGSYAWRTFIYSSVPMFSLACYWLWAGGKRVGKPEQRPSTPNFGWD